MLAPTRWWRPETNRHAQRDGNIRRPADQKLAARAALGSVGGRWSRSLGETDKSMASRSAAMRRSSKMAMLLAAGTREGWPAT